MEYVCAAAPCYLNWNLIFRGLETFGVQVSPCSWGKRRGRNDTTYSTAVGQPKGVHAIWRNPFHPMINIFHQPSYRLVTHSGEGPRFKSGKQ
jgi:hypothetical protein